MPNRFSLVFAALCPLAAVIAPAFASQPADAPHWGYAGLTGPTHWAELGHADLACAEGRRQSPIALEASRAVPHETDFRILYRPSKAQLVNNGHTVEADIAGDGDSVVFAGETYRLKQFHFHTPSEHTLDGKRYPLEIHFVNQSEDGRIAVVGVLVEQGAENRAVAELFDGLPAPDGRTELHKEIDLTGVLPVNRHALLYTGSLTTPPCTEGVHWIVFAQPVDMSAAQIRAFQRLYPDNHRPLQQPNGREIDAE